MSPTPTAASISPDTHLVFAATIDVLFRKTLASFITPDVTEGIRAAGIDLSKPLVPAYPIRVFDDAMEVVAVRGMQHLQKSEAMRCIGELQVESFTQTFLGKATFQFLKLLSRDRFADRLARSFRQANNYVETRVTKDADGSLLIWVNDVGRFPEVFQGILKAGFEAAGHPTEVEPLGRDGIACSYRASALRVKAQSPAQ